MLPIDGGDVDVLLWGAAQLGSWGTLDHRAWAGAVEAGFQPRLLPSLRPWLRLGWYRSSGDDNPLDDEHGTFFQVLPTPRIYARFPFYNLMNLEDLFATLTLRPAPGVTLQGNVHALGLSSAEDLWYVGGGAFQKGSFGYGGRPAGGFNDLAVLYDASAALRLSPNLNATLYAGWSDGGDVIEAIYPAGASGRLAYLEFAYQR